MEEDKLKRGIVIMPALGADPLMVQHFQKMTRNMLDVTMVTSSHLCNETSGVSCFNSSQNLIMELKNHRVSDDWDQYIMKDSDNTTPPPGRSQKQHNFITGLNKRKR